MGSFVPNQDGEEMGLEMGHLVSALALRLCYWRGSLGKRNDFFQIVQPDGGGFFIYL